MATVIIRTEIEVPLGVLTDVADLLIDHDMDHKIVATDADEGTISLEISYDKEERDVFHEITDLIEDYQEKSDEDDDE